jgi:soluble epoxide hydrolase/lipid-phosphate phosphatase
VFVGAATKDYICLADMQIATAEAHCPQLTVRKYDSSHWVLWSHADELNPDLLAWVEGLTGKPVL